MPASTSGKPVRPRCHARSSAGASRHACARRAARLVHHPCHISVRYAHQWTTWSQHALQMKTRAAHHINHKSLVACMRKQSRIRHKMRMSPAPCRTLGGGTSSARARLARVVRPDGLRRHARPVQQLPAGQVAPGQAPAERLADRRPAARARLLGQHTRTQLPEVQVRRQARHCARVRKLPLRLVPREACARRTWPCKCGRVPYCACALPNQRMQQLSHLAGMSDAFLVTQ